MKLPQRLGEEGGALFEPAQPTVAAFFLGGTIGMSAGSAGAVVNVSHHDLLDNVPQLAAISVTVVPRPFRQLPSGALSFDDIAELVGEAAELPCDGVVVVQGTDTIEETAYLIDLLWSKDGPIVVTGAMRNTSLASPDGPANLLAAVTVAASSCFRGLGALVVLNDEVHAARYVRKTHTISTSTFASPALGPLGRLVEGRAHRTASVARRRSYGLAGPMAARVPLVTVALDDGGETMDGLAERCDGAVLLALGAGHVPPRLVPVLATLAARVPVVLSTRTFSGPTLSRTYGYEGSETELLTAGLIGAGLLDGLKARVLLRVLIACGCDRGEITEAFAEASGLR